MTVGTVGLGRRAADRLARWARACGLTIEHLDGCPGVVVPGVAVLIDHRLPAPERRRRIAELLRKVGALQGP